MDMNIMDSRLRQFDTYGHFERFCKELFELTPDETNGLYDVLLKLQSIGEDPIRILRSWKTHKCGEDCANFIRFMIMVDQMDMADIQMAAG